MNKELFIVEVSLSKFGRRYWIPEKREFFNITEEEFSGLQKAIWMCIEKYIDRELVKKHN